MRKRKVAVVVSRKIKHAHAKPVWKLLVFLCIFTWIRQQMCLSKSYTMQAARLNFVAEPNSFATSQAEPAQDHPKKPKSQEATQRTSHSTRQPHATPETRRRHKSRAPRNPQITPRQPQDPKTTTRNSKQPQRAQTTPNNQSSLIQETQTQSKHKIVSKNKQKTT